ncbi:hypothetical protein JHK82_052911 [Glycine max]|nr:hypothetical protein JHK85_053617 [Glycine max]KAG5082753.1 hypothetical protein JHK84_052791 [Glycine max]KAG5085514.1 hypothetical protein JHK82_052911 [Glycine max]
MEQRQIKELSSSSSTNIDLDKRMGCLIYPIMGMCTSWDLDSDMISLQPMFRNDFLEDKLKPFLKSDLEP